MRFRFSLASQTTTEVQEAVAIRDVIEKIAPKAIQLPENGLTTYSLLFDQRDSFREELMKKTDGLHTSEAMVELTHRLADASWIFVVRSTYGLYYEVVLPETLGRQTNNLTSALSGISHQRERLEEEARQFKTALDQVPLYDCAMA
jgi:hypothetical protein